MIMLPALCQIPLALGAPRTLRWPSPSSVFFFFFFFMEGLQYQERERRLGRTKWARERLKTWVLVKGELHPWLAQVVHPSSSVHAFPCAPSKPRGGSSSQWLVAGCAFSFFLLTQRTLRRAAARSRYPRPSPSCNPWPRAKHTGRHATRLRALPPYLQPRGLPVLAPV